MWLDPPLFAVQRCDSSCCGSSRWLVWEPSDDPCTPAVRLVTVLDDCRINASMPPMLTDTPHAFGCSRDGKDRAR
jgi:hypothetical protein